MGRDQYALELQGPLGLGYADAKWLASAVTVSREHFRTELGAIAACAVTMASDRRTLLDIARGERSWDDLAQRGLGPPRYHVIDALLVDEVASEVWTLRIDAFAEDLSRLDRIVEDVEDDDLTADEAVAEALSQANWLSSDHRRWLAAVREALLRDDSLWASWWWSLDPRIDLSNTARVLRSYDERLRPSLGERLTADFRQPTRRTS